VALKKAAGEAADCGAFGQFELDLADLVLQFILVEYVDRDRRTPVWRDIETDAFPSAIRALIKPYFPDRIFTRVAIDTSEAQLTKDRRCDRSQK